MYTSSVLSIAAMAAAAAANPVAHHLNLAATPLTTQTAVVTLAGNPAEIRSRLSLATAAGGAEDHPKATGVPTRPNNKIANGGPDSWTIGIFNFQADYEVDLVHVEGAGSPAPVGGEIPAQVLQKWGYHEFQIPKGYHGNVAFNKHGLSVTNGDESQIEFSYIDQYKNGNFIFDINVSYVNGFTLPAYCVCGEWYHDNYDHATGCGKDLWSLNSCPDDNGQGACKNPQRPFHGDVGATPFFQPCKYPGGAYTYPDDNLANNMNGSCDRGKIQCCVGPNCIQLDKGPSK